MNLHSLIHEIHIASSGDLSTLKQRVIDSGLAGPELETGNFNQYFSLAYNHVWREFNRKCYNFGLTGLMVTPYNGGLRPIPPALSGLSNGTTTTLEPVIPPVNAYLQPNGIDYYLQPDGRYYYEYVTTTTTAAPTTTTTATPTTTTTTTTQGPTTTTTTTSGGTTTTTTTNPPTTTTTSGATTSTTIGPTAPP